MFFYRQYLKKNIVLFEHCSAVDGAGGAGILNTLDFP